MTRWLPPMGLALALLLALAAPARAQMLEAEHAVRAEAPAQAPAARDDDTVLYLYDDGDGNTNQGPPSTFDPDMLWGNYFLTEAGGEVITEIHVAFGPTFPSLENGPVTFWLLDDPDMNLDPLSATVLASVEATPDVFNDNFFTVEIPPTEVSGAFFVGASAKLLGGQDRPARVDTGARADRSWFCYAPEIADVIEDLASAPYCSRMDGGDVVFPGAFMVRALGQPAGGNGGEEPELIAYWNFNESTGGTSGGLGTLDTYDATLGGFPADHGSGLITTDFEINTVAGTSDENTGDLGSFGGSTINALFGDGSGGALAVRGQANNGKYIQFEFDASTYEDIQLSWAGRGTGTGFGPEDAPNTVQYSSNGGVTFTDLTTYTSRQTDFELYEFDFGSALDRTAGAVIRLVFDGATSAGGNNRLDNVQILGTPAGDPGQDPLIAVSPEALELSVTIGEAASEQLAISNVGGGTLSWSITTANSPTSTLDLSRPAQPAQSTASPLARVTEAPAREAVERLREIALYRGGTVSVAVLSPDAQSSDPSPPTNILDDLNAFPDISAEMYTAPLADITAADLAGYDVVVTSNNQQWAAVSADVSVGNALADYIDGGGKVVVMNYAHDNFGWQLAGRFITGGYSPFNMSTGDLSGSVTMQIVETGHPIVEGVGTVTHGSIRSNVTVRSGATLIANWGASNPAVAATEDVVAINALYGSLVQWSGDLDVLLHNAVVWLAGDGGGAGCENPADIAWLSVSPESGSTGAGQTDVVTVTVDASGLDVGEHEAVLCIESNDTSGQDLVVVPVTANVGPVATEDGALPLAFALAPSYPNPFAGHTTIGFALPEATSVRLSVFDATGRLVATLVDGEREAGTHEVAWSARGLASGVYFVRLEAGSYRATQKVVLAQ